MIPKFAGENPDGATYQGVTNDTMSIVQWRNKIDEVTSAALKAVDFQMSQQQYEDAVGAPSRFNKRYNPVGLHENCRRWSLGKWPAGDVPVWHRARAHS